MKLHQFVTKKPDPLFQRAGVSATEAEYLEG